MRTFSYGMVLAAAIALLGTTSTSAAPVSGAVIDTAATTASLSDQVDCRRYPHRHRGAKPHGFGFGCPKKPVKPAPKMTK